DPSCQLLRPAAGHVAAELGELGQRGPELELEALAPQEMPVDRVLDVGAQAAVQVLRRGRDARAGLRRPELRDPGVARGRALLGELPGRRPGDRAQALEVDRAV